MSRQLLPYRWALLLLLSIDEAPVRAGDPSPTRGNYDLNLDGRIDDQDLLSLLDRFGAYIGQESYSVGHDLQSDGNIDGEDLLEFQYGWRGVATRSDPISTEEFLDRTGLNDLSGKTWRFKCLLGGSEDCLGEKRTVTGGGLTEINGRMVLPIIWGSGSGEPWAILYLTMEGDLGFLGVEKAGKPDLLPGLTLVPQTIGISGLIPWTTSETVYPGSPVVGNETASLTYSLVKGGDTPLDQVCETIVRILVEGKSVPGNPVFGRSVEIGEFNGDGIEDVVAGLDDGTLRVYLISQLPSGALNLSHSNDIVKHQGITISLASGDVDGDGTTDFVAGNIEDPDGVYLNNGTGDAFTRTDIGSSPTTENSSSVGLGDFNNDGFLDLLDANVDTPTRVYFNNQTDSPFEGVAGTDLTDSPLTTRSVAIGDLDGDGDLDVVEGNYDRTNRLYLNNGTSQPFLLVGGFEFEGEPRRTSDIELGDVDFDGDLDVVEASLEGPIRFYANNGTTTPFAGVMGRDLELDARLEVGGFRAVALGKFVRREFLDLIAIGRGITDLRYHEFNGEPLGTRSRIHSLLESYQYDIAASDMDGDGDSEVVMVGYDGEKAVNFFYNRDGVVKSVDLSQGIELGSTGAKGPVRPQSGLILVSGEGSLGEPGGFEAHAEWNLFFDQDGLQFIQLCWELMGERKCLSYGRIPDATDDGGGPLGCMVETVDIGGFQDQFATLARDECYRASVSDGDFWDAFRVLSATTTADLYILVQNLQGTGLQINIYAGSPSFGNLVYTENFDEYFERTFNDVPAGVDYWIEILFLGTPVSYQLRALTLDS
ncbi:MAG: hypothetical protein GHCLOJNM_00062 [bacterium]|nr:hypothetical protein [bacterium]